MNYHDKRALLIEELDDLRMDHARAALRFEQGAGDEAAVAKAAADVAQVEGRLNALEAARQEGERQAAIARAEADREARKAALNVVDNALDDRRVAADKIEAAGALIAEAVALWTAADQAIIEAMRHHFAGEELGRMRSLAFPNPRPDHLLLIGLIGGAGVPVSSINADYARRRVAEVSVNEMLLTERKRIRSFSDKLKEPA